ncbi:MAG: hypothetical protein AAFX94_18055, partial [Myxococcota bacterium]
MPGNDPRVRVHAPDGSEHYYLCRNWTDLDEGVARQCVPETNLDSSTHLWQEDSGKWRWTSGDGSRWEFFSNLRDGRYHYEYHRNSVGRIISRAFVSGSGRLTRVETDDSSKSLHFQYNGAGLISYVKLNGSSSSARVIGYSYIGGSLRDVNWADQPNSDPDDRSKRYVYTTIGGRPRLSKIQGAKAGSGYGFYDQVVLSWGGQDALNSVRGFKQHVQVLDRRADGQEIRLAYVASPGADFATLDFKHFGSPFIQNVDGDFKNPLGFAQRVYLSNGLMACQGTQDGLFTRSYLELNSLDEVVFITDDYGTSLTPETCYEDPTSGPVGSVFSRTWVGTRFGEKAQARQTAWVAKRSDLSDSTTVSCNRVQGSGNAFVGSNCSGQIIEYNGRDQVSKVHRINQTQEGESGTRFAHRATESRYYFSRDPECSSSETSGMAGGAKADKVCGVTVET